jgi:hypothetical protein
MHHAGISLCIELKLIFKKTNPASNSNSSSKNIGARELEEWKSNNNNN